MPIIPVQFTCEECGTLRKETNNWLYTTLEDNSLTISPLDAQYVTNLTNREVSAWSLKVHCGESCVLKYVSQNLANLHKEKQ